MAAVNKDGYGLRYADESLKKNYNIVMAAIKNNRQSFIFADECLKE